MWKTKVNKKKKIERSVGISKMFWLIRKVKTETAELFHKRENGFNSKHCTYTKMRGWCNKKCKDLNWSIQNQVIFIFVVHSLFHFQAKVYVSNKMHVILNFPLRKIVLGKNLWWILLYLEVTCLQYYFDKLLLRSIPQNNCCKLFITTFRLRILLKLSYI